MHYNEELVRKDGKTLYWRKVHSALPAASRFTLITNHLTSKRNRWEGLRGASKGNLGEQQLDSRQTDRNNIGWSLEVLLVLQTIAKTAYQQANTHNISTFQEGKVGFDKLWRQNNDMPQLSTKQLQQEATFDSLKKRPKSHQMLFQFGSFKSPSYFTQRLVLTKLCWSGLRMCTTSRRNNSQDPPNIGRKNRGRRKTKEPG